jgi:hypothetical protein
MQRLQEEVEEKWIKPKTENKHVDRGRVWGLLLLLNEGVEIEELDRLTTVAKDVFKDEVKKTEKEESTPRRTTDN